MKVAIALCVLFVGAYCAPMLDEQLSNSWNLFKRVHAKQYSTVEEEAARRNIWEANVAKIRQHNLEADIGIHTYTLGMNRFGDMTHEEFVKQMNGYKASARNTEFDRHNFLAPSNIAIPDAVDWRKDGYVTPIKDQGQCGSCWAFSATGSLEGQHFAKTKQLVSLSEQNLVDCSGKFGNMGCDGGLMDSAFQYIKANEGIDTESSYPYEARDGKCRFKKENVGATDTGFVDIKAKNETDLQLAIATVGPVSVAIDASQDSFQFYQSGVYNEPACSTTELDHGVLAVGYDKSGSTEYYIVTASSHAAMMQPPPQQQWAMAPPPPPQYYQAGPPPAAMWAQPPPQVAPAPAPASSGGGAGDEARTLWIGDLQYWMDENYLYSCFSQAGEVISVKIIRNKQTGQPEGYGFIEFSSHALAEQVLQSYNGQMMPNGNQAFKLNWATSGAGEKRGDDGSDFTIFVGDLASDVTDFILQDTFKSHYPSVKGAKVVFDRTTGHSKGYGFVKFGDVDEQTRAMTEMNGQYCSSRPMRIGPASNSNKRNAPGQPQAPNVMYQNAQGTDPDNDPNNTTVFVGGLDSSVTDELLKQTFSPYGEIVYVKIPVGKRCGFVQYSNRASAEEAIRMLNGSQLGGQSVRLSWGRSPANKQPQQDQSQWSGGYYGYPQGYDPYGYARPPQDPAMYAYTAYPGYGNYQQQPPQQPPAQQ